MYLPERLRHLYQAGDIAKDKYGIESVTASKVMECIPCALRQILQVEN